MKEKTEFECIEIDKPFNVIGKDKTVLKKEKNGGLLIYFHAEGFWCNPPTDTNMEVRIKKAIEKKGIEYLDIF